MGKRIEVQDFSLYYGDFKAVADVTLTMAPNTVTALIGPSGTGKSTFIRGINRLHEVAPTARTTGAILVDGQNLYDRNVDPVDVRREIGMVFQNPNPFPTMSIYDNVAAGYKLNNRRVARSRMDEIVERSLRGANLWDEVSNRLRNAGAGLSGGQQQRLCIARAIAVEPAVLLMDEPASALDPISTEAIEDLIHELKENYTIVIVTHNMQQATRVSDMTAFFNIEGSGTPGRVVEYDTTEKIFHDPQQEDTRRYVSGQFG